MTDQKVNIEEILLHHKMWLETPDGQGILGDGKWKILKTVDQEGSLTAACQKLGLTYRRTWGDLKKIEQQLGFPLLNKSRGGKEGGMSELSPQGKALTAAFDRFHSRVDEVVAEAFDTFRHTLRELEGIQ
ncbi:MAG: LysR family transcriptional regulator [Bacteroidales bacterium]|jgi:molybdate transport system regulatory protein|nr:LysR family transcriptional regulator [Bacteroidales bacterium]NCU35493.1 LysR family transcriptional regulator [Candidatus Falkowbacteria bacterium]MDD2633061.1 LysR family transcriptional regulator [Bacteroidales bacterium]MDD4176154.1 LysR family transcriptional regulator [Bacteroidales bacterium]MDD4740559.1 LysR family transcriptional regulator [Bacteroidales bacterium]